MKTTETKKRSFNPIARDYFDYVGKHLPQQCASDEFYFLPRAEAAVDSPNRLDDLTPERVQDHLRTVKSLLSQMSPEKHDDLEKEIDRVLLVQSMRSFIREFGDAECWRNDPILYVKIPLFAMDMILSQSNSPRDRAREGLCNILSQVPSFLDLAAKNLRLPSEISAQVARDMAQDACDFHTSSVQAFIAKRIGHDPELLAKNQIALEAWERYREMMPHLASRKSFAVGKDGLNKILRISLSYPRSPEEILEIAQETYRRTHEKVRELAKRINSRKTWEGIISELLPRRLSPAELEQLVVKEVQNLRRFFYTQDMMTVPSGEKVTVLHTPSHLQSLRATASYKAPLTGHTRGHGVFYVTPGEEDLELISIHCPFLSAHETYPGHHILDHSRIHHPNPIRRQIESPLFYEGWACYVEQLLSEFGYIQDPRQQLVQLKRLIWRSMRAILDIELQTAKITLDEGAERMRTIGFSTGRTHRQIRRFALTPGYQLCYFMGMYEILQLRERFSSQMGLKPFHDNLLSGGEIPFYLAERRLEAHSAEASRA
jgi:hypothetical protein